MYAEYPATSSDSKVNPHSPENVADFSSPKDNSTTNISRRQALKMSLATLGGITLGVRTSAVVRAQEQELAVDPAMGPDNEEPSLTAPVVLAGAPEAEEMAEQDKLVYKQDYVATFGTELQNRAVENLEGTGLRAHHTPQGYAVIRPRGSNHTRAEVWFKRGGPIDNGSTTTRARLETPGNWGVFMHRQDNGIALNFYIRTGEQGRLWAASYSDAAGPFTGWQHSDAIRPNANENTLKMVSDKREVALVINDSHITTVRNDRLGPGYAGYSVGAPGKLKDIVAVVQSCEITRH